MTTRVEAERIRAREQITRLRDTLDSIEVLVEGVDSVGFDTPQTVLLTAGVLSATLSRLDAYQRSEQDSELRSANENCRCWHSRSAHHALSGHCQLCDCERFFG